MMKNIGKSNQESDLLRAEGNQLYARKDFFDALVKYNESLCFAEPESENLGLAYANRSAVYYEMKLYDKCLINVELARENCYPEKNFEILKIREEKCKEILKTMKNEKDSLNNFKLSYPENKNLPFVADCLELKIDKKFGRHIVTKQALKVGDVLAIEKPFCKIVQDRFVHQRCSGCFIDNLLDLIPCGGCTKAMFCSRDCISFSFKSFHQYECPLMNVMSSSLLSSTTLKALRTFFVALPMFDGSIDDLEKFLNENQRSCTIFDGVLNDSKQTLLAVNSLIYDETIKVNDNVFEQIFNVSPVLKTMFSSHGQFIRNFLRKQSQIATMNYHEIYSWPLKKGGLSDEDVDKFKGSLAYKRGVIATGNGSYPFCALINHNCAPNVSKIFINEQLVVIVQRSIEKGEQIFDNYGYNFTNVPKEDRQLELTKQYKFRCSCEACTSNWPILPGLKVSDKSLLNKAKKACRELTLAGLNQKKAKDKYNELSEIIEKNKKNFPTLEICSMMENAAAYLEMITKPSVQFA